MRRRWFVRSAGRVLGATIIAAMLAAMPSAARGEVIASGAEINHPPVAPGGVAPEPGAPLEWIMAGGAVAAAALIVWRRWYRLDCTPGALPALAPPVAFVLALAMLVLGSLGVMAARQVFDIGPSTSEVALPPSEALAVDAKLRLGGYALQAVAVAIYFRLRSTRGRGGRSGNRSGRMGAMRAVLVGLGALLVSYPIMVTISTCAAWVQSRLTGQGVDVLAHETLRLLQDSPRDAWYFTSIALALVAAPFFEEVLYRGMVQEGLQGMCRSRWTAIVISSLVFVAAHVQAVPAHGLAALLALSLAFGWAYARTGRLLASVTMHTLFNGANLALAHLVAPG